MIDLLEPIKEKILHGKNVNEETGELIRISRIVLKKEWIRVKELK